MWRWLSTLHPQRRTPIDAKEIEATLSIYGIRDHDRRVELASVIAALEHDFLNYSPDDEEKTKWQNST